MEGINERHAISRASQTGRALTITNSLETTPAVNMQNYASFGVVTENQLSSVDFYVSYDGTTFVKLAVDTPLVLTDQKAFAAPPEVWPFPFVKMVANTTTPALIGVVA